MHIVFHSLSFASQSRLCVTFSRYSCLVANRYVVRAGNQNAAESSRNGRFVMVFIFTVMISRVLELCFKKRLARKEIGRINRYKATGPPRLLASSQNCRQQLGRTRRRIADNGWLSERTKDKGRRKKKWNIYLELRRTDRGGVMLMLWIDLELRRIMTEVEGRVKHLYFLTN